MSDEEFYSEESYEFEFEDEDEAQATDKAEDNEEISLEAKYYTAKGLKYDDVDAAIESLQEITKTIPILPEDINWIFKSHKQLVKITFNSGRYQEALSYLNDLIAVLPKVGDTYAEDSLTKIVNNYTSSGNIQFVNELYEIVLRFLKQAKVTTPTYDRLWLRIGINQLKQHLELRDFSECKTLLDQIHSKLTIVSEFTKKSYLLDVITCEIEYLFLIRPLNLPKLNILYKQSVSVTTAVTHPRQIGVIQECGAKIQFYRGNYEKARLEFYESFNSYDEAGSSLKKKILKYLTLCSLLTENQFNPFESQETSTYSALPEYSQLLLLIKAYDESNLSKLISLVNLISKSDDTLSKDDIFQHASKQIIINLREKALKNYLRAYKAIKFDYLRLKLDLSQSELEQFLKKLVLTGRLTNIKLDYSQNAIVSEIQTPLPLTLNSKDIFFNMKVSTAISAQLSHDGMDIDPKPRPSRPSTDSRPCFGSTSSDPSIRFLYLDKPSSDMELLKQVETWSGYVYSCIPSTVKNELSQKDQIAFEQRAELGNIKYDKLNEELDQNTKGGILSSTIEDNDIEDDLGNAEVINKVDILSNWLGELEGYFAEII